MPLSPSFPPINGLCSRWFDQYLAGTALTSMPATLWSRPKPQRARTRHTKVHTMPVTKDDVLAALGKVAAPDGTPLPKTGTLSDIVATDGNVFFSITVDAGVVQAWESVRKRAEEAVKAIPGVQSAMVALTAERKPGSAARPQGAPAPGRPAHTHGHGSQQGP